VKSYDLIVIGGGSGGLATAQRAAEHGRRVALFEPQALGGTCVNVGCVPKKIMWNAAEMAECLARAGSYGYRLTVEGHDWRVLKQGRDAYVARLNGIYQRNLERKSIEWIRQTARFAGAKEVLDERDDVYRAEHIVIATGGYPLVPEVPGADLGITSDGFFELDRLPGRVAVVGSGYVAVELAGVLHALGSEVTLFMRFDRLLREFDSLLSEFLMEHMQAAGIRLVIAAVPHAMHAARGLALKTRDGRVFEDFDTLIWAIGRSPNTRGLELASAGVELDAEGRVSVDDYQNTNVEGIYAVGDVCGRAELTPVAIAAGRRLADRLFGGQPERHLSYEVIPTVVFSHPPLGTIGLTEEAARERYPHDEVHIHATEFVPMLHALTEVKPLTAMKLVTVGAEERVVGCHVIGPGADEMMQGFAVAMTMGACKKDFDETIAIHPTSAEELVTMR
jgi:glutathione reductase (NADPH)